MITARKLTRTLATLAIAASAVGGVVYGATDAAYAAHFDAGCALFHCHWAAVHASRTHIQRQFAVHLRCGLCERRHPEVSVARHPNQCREALPRELDAVPGPTTAQSCLR